MIANRLRSQESNASGGGRRYRVRGNLAGATYTSFTIEAGTGEGRYASRTAGVLNDLIHFAVSIPVIVAFMLYYREYPSVAWIWWIPFLVAVQLLFTYSVALFLAT